MVHERGVSRDWLASMARAYLVASGVSLAAAGSHAGATAVFVLVDAARNRVCVPEKALGRYLHRAVRCLEAPDLSPALKALYLVCAYSNLERTQVLGTLGQLLTEQGLRRRLLTIVLMGAPSWAANGANTDSFLVQCALASAAFALGIIVDRDESMARQMAFPDDAENRERAFTLATAISVRSDDDQVFRYCLSRGADPFLTANEKGLSMVDLLVNRGDIRRLKILVRHAHSRLHVASLWQLLTNLALQHDAELMAMCQQRIQTVSQEA